MAASAYFDQVQQLYIAYFGRPADTVGQAFWASKIDAANGSIASVIAGFSASTESQALFGNLTTTQKVTAIYQNAFGRTPEATGLAYWVAQIDSGKVTQAQASWTIQQSAGPGDASAVNNKLIAAKAFTAQIDTAAEIAGYSGAAAATLARAYLAKADATYASIANVATDSIAALATASGTAAVPPVTPVSTPFTATKDGSNVVTFANAGTAISVTESAGTYTFTSNGINAGTATVTGTINGITVPTSATLSISSTLATSKTFAGSGTVGLSDTGSLTTAALKAIEAATTGLLDASNVTSITGASLADAQLLLVTNQGTSGDKIKTAANIAVTLTDTTATGAILKAVDDATTGVVNASTITSITSSTVAAAKQLLVTDLATFTHAANVTVALTDTTAAAGDLNALDSSTTGMVTAASLTSITGALADVKMSLEAITGGLTLNAAGLTSVTMTDAITTSALDNVMFANNTTITLANVANNAITTINTNVTLGKTLTIDGSGLTGTNSLTFNGAAETDGSYVVKGGAGADIIAGGAGADTLTGGAGIDQFSFSAANRSTLAATDTITDFRAATGANAGALDIITISDITTVASNINTVQDLSAQASLAAALNVFANAATTNNGLGVFIWGGNSYAYVESTGSAFTYVAGDTVIKLSGTPFTAGTSIVGLGIDGV